MSPKPNDFDQHVMDQRLRHLAVALPPEPLPTALRTRILDPLPISNDQPQRMRLRLVAAGLAACVTLLFLVAGPHLSGLRPASAAEVHAAILRANTWHFVGWHLRNGQKVHWEVWGRRVPYFYREQIGDEVFLDDGTRSTHILPPDPKSGREHGIVLILPSPPRSTLGSATTGTGEANFLVGIGGDADRYQRLGSTGNDETFAAQTEYLGYPYDIKETATLMVDKTAQLPVRYFVSRTESQPKGKPDTTAGINYTLLKKVREYTQAELIPSYDLLLPASIAEINAPAGYTVADATSPSPKLDGSEGSICSQSGLTVRAEVLGQDTNGDLHLRFYSWLGSQPLNYRNTGLMLEGARAPGRYGTDDSANSYLYIRVPGGAGPGDGGIDLWLVPVTPFTSQTPQPRTLDLAVPLSVTRYESLAATGGRLIPVTTQQMSFHLKLPREPQDLGYEAAAGCPGIDFFGPRPSLANEAAEARANYYMEQPTIPVNGAAAKIDYERAAYWWNAAAQAATHTGDASRAAMDRSNAATMQQLQKQAAP